MNDSRYVIRPRADATSIGRLYYYATEANSAVGRRFLLAAHDTFSLLATQPDMGWRAYPKNSKIERLRVFRVNLQAFRRREGLE